MRVEVASSRTVVAVDVEVASTLGRRLKGLLGRAPLQGGRALVLEPASQVHTFGMTYPIDVVFCDRRGVVKHVVRALRPRRVSRWVRGSRKVIEMAAGDLPQEVVPGIELVFYEDPVNGQ